MTNFAIDVQNLGKRYLVRGHRDPHGRLTESLSRIIRSPIDTVRSRRAKSDHWIWALRDVSFKVAHSEVVGVIGRNGSGKTTLLKILSRITEPTAGRAILEGRVGSLLEVGTGFHPELTGRENIQMSGAILGMRRAEIARKFDEIVEFAGVDRFIDTPVKRFSSGMEVRLGFAVAAHLDPEILFIDEVLAVGDAEFQKKCLGKMAELGRGGRTILFVSHSLPTVLRVCGRAILLDQGRIAAYGRTPDVVHAYLKTDTGRSGERRWDDLTRAPGDEFGKLRSIRVSSAGGKDEVDIRDPVDVEVEYWIAGRADPRPALTIDAFNEDGVFLFSVTDQPSKGWQSIPVGKSGFIRATCRIPGNFLAEGRVTLNVAVVTFNPFVGHAVELNAVAFLVVDRTEGAGARGSSTGKWPGVVRPMLDWTVDWNPDERQPY